MLPCGGEPGELVSRLARVGREEQQAPIPLNRLPIVRSIVNSVIYPWEKRSVQN